MLFDSYLNNINYELRTAFVGDDYTGIFGLGERASKDFFFQDGVYTMWAKD